MRVNCKACLGVFSTGWSRASASANTLTEYSYRVMIHGLVQLQVCTVLISCFLVAPHYSDNKSMISIFHLAELSSTSSSLSLNCKYGETQSCIPGWRVRCIILTSFSSFTSLVIWKSVAQTCAAQFVLYKGSCLLLLVSYSLDVYRIVLPIFVPLF